ncbi:ureidoglycolate lyase [Entomortierella parvispora]|uniref:Ureidoglycolate lyase n=1 Tax=Entomortierella parvispora TaxID=205924 RepID=A0A9P3HGU1_9FUNG|nr:ureidoglycolate lyase [Entomortierella parvispora]
MPPISIFPAPEKAAISAKSIVSDTYLSLDGISEVTYQPVPIEELDSAFGGYVDLAAKTQGGRVLAVSDEWLVIKLGYPSSIVGFEVDTSSASSQPPLVSVEGLIEPATSGDRSTIEKRCEREGVFDRSHHPTSAEDWAGQPWASLLREVGLSPSSRQGFKLKKSSSVSFTHIRFRRSLEGKLSCLRVYGSARQSFPEDRHEVFDLVSMAAGSTVTGYSNGHFGHPSNLLLPGRGQDTSDGWGTNMSSAEDDVVWCQINLGAAGHPTLIEVDTAHYKSTSAKMVTVHGFAALDTLQESPIVLLADATLKPHIQNFFRIPPEVSAGSPICSLKVTLLSGGGVQRVRVFGSRSWPAAMIQEDSPIGRRQMLEDEHTWNSKTLLAEPITSEAFAPWGQVIAIPNNDSNSILINQGTAQKFSNVGEFVNWRSYAAENHSALPDRSNPAIPAAKANIAVLHCNSPLTTSKIDVKMLERHPHSSQMFVPLGSDDNAGYVVVVAMDNADGSPDATTLKVFTVKNCQGINYKPNVWHHPMVITGKPMTFLTITHESGVAKDDCEVHWFNKEIDKDKDFETITVSLLA